jgi:N-acetylglutamate synthase-like GNAT family acetyltransferase
MLGENGRLSPLYRSREVQIKKATPSHRVAIRRLHLMNRSPHARQIRIHEYFVALVGRQVVGCAAIFPVPGGGYLYGRAVTKEWRRKGIGAALLTHRVEWLKNQGARLALSLVMFWNVSTFRRLGFRTVPREDLPPNLRRIKDFQDERNRHCATVWIDL